MLASLVLPDSVELVRTTPRFTSETVPPGLRRAHRLAPDVWGRLRVLDGSVRFVLEGSGESRLLGVGDEQVIPPDVEHHVEPSDGAAFEVQIFRA